MKFLFFDTHAQDSAEHGSNHAEHEGSEYAPPEAIHHESETEELREPRSQHEQQAVDDEAKEPKREDVQRNRNDSNKGPNDRVHDAEYQRHDEKGADEAPGRIFKGHNPNAFFARATNNESGQPQCHCEHNHSSKESHRPKFRTGTLAGHPNKSASSGACWVDS